ncbi:hypothetical protein GCM10007916_11670 [Psychromonas marina]|uniref:PaaI family thioesterase n=1 Tax=Psychromonas marina TaxID=88364 RepID=A0ABQ6DYD3_9GAMM|nr:PaaI family thioesterase [Psychromonas marina]GLS90100.1 hypothetical protein GCM10007916_11670 [Psychromonas marina]
MIDKGRIPKELLAIFEDKLQGRSEGISVPPPVFDTMKGEFVNYSVEKNVLVNRFPILTEHLNPYGNMQGGIVSAAIDNTIGPLSMLVSAPNFTRNMEVKYGKVISPDLEYIYVIAKFIEKKKRQLFFEATVEDKDGNKLATAKSVHWVID